MSGGLVARHVARSSLKASYYFEKPEDLEKLAEAGQGLMAEFLFVLGVPAQNPVSREFQGRAPESSHGGD